jgi:hypothetical protein
MYRYRTLLRTDLNATDVHDVRKAVACSVPLGNTLFKEEVQGQVLNRE